MEQVNIPRSCTDKFYRYKMPIMQIKIEGKGNGIRTVVTNMEKVMKALDRPMEYAAKFIAFELGTKSHVDLKQHSCTFAGKHDVETLANLLDKFISMYVLCIKCGNPETIIKVKHDVIASKCKACGKVFKIDMNHKLSSFIINSNKKEIIKNEKEVVKKIVVNDEWTYDTSEQAVLMRKQDLFGIENVYPAEKFIVFIQTAPPKTKVSADLSRLKLSQDWSDNALLKYVFRCLFTDIKSHFYQKVEYIKPYVETDKEMLLLLSCIEVTIEEGKYYNDVNHILNGFYETELLEEDIIMKWFHGKSKVVSEEADNKIKDNAKIFIDWLQHADYDI
jgi:translation initiation factor 5